MIRETDIDTQSRYKTVTSAYTPSMFDRVIFADSTGGDVAITLPDASKFEGKIFSIVQIAASNSVTIATVNGGTTTLSSQYDKYTVASNGLLWYIIG